MKRLVGVPGDTIAMRDTVLVVNGRVLDYAPLAENCATALPQRLRSGHVFAQDDLTGRRHAVLASPARPAVRSFDPVTVPAGCYLVLGDNRDNSYDSRFFGFVPGRQILGRAFGVAFSLDRDRHWLPRWDRICRGLE